MAFSTEYICGRVLKLRAFHNYPNLYAVLAVTVLFIETEISLSSSQTFSHNVHLIDLQKAGIAKIRH